MLPGQTIRVLDPGLGLVDVAADSPICMGASSAGTTGTLYSFSALSDIRTTLGYGDLPEAVARELNQAGGPVLAMRTTGAIAGTISAVTRTGASPVCTAAAATPTMRTATRIQVMKGGVLGTAEFRYTHDNFQPTKVQPTWSEQRTVPAGGTFVMPNTGITFTFVAGTYVLNDTYDLTTEPAHVNATDIGNMGASLVAIPTFASDQWLVSDTFSTASEGYAAATALGAQLQTMATGFKWARGHCDVGSTDTAVNVIAGRSAFQDVRVAPCYGSEIRSSLLPFEGYANQLASCSTSLAARAARVVASSSLSRYAEGSLQGTQWIAFDSNSDITVDNAKISTLRTYPKVPGFYIARGRLAAAPGSDFQFWQYGVLMDIGCSAIFQAMLQFTSDDLRTLDGGTLDPLDAAIVQTAGLGALRTALMSPKNARGRAGWVSDVLFSVDLTNNVAASGILQTTASIRPRAYTDFISQTIGFRLNLAA